MIVMRKIKLFISTLLISLTLPVCSIAQGTVALDNVVHRVAEDPSMVHASLSVSVHNVTHNSVVYTYEAHRSLIPGSLTKLFTTAVGFKTLGSDFRFKTTLAYDGNIDEKGVLHGNIYIIGGGDPLLGSYRYQGTCPDSLFTAWLHDIKTAGIKSVDGRICYDATIFDNAPLHDSWQYGDIGNYYASGISGLNFHENMYFIYFDSKNKKGFPEISGTSPDKLGIRNQNEVRIAGANTGDNVIVYGDPFTPVRLCRGTVPEGKSRFPIRASMPNPAARCAELFALFLRENNVNVSSAVSEVYSRADNLTTIQEHYSNPYYVIAKYTNLTSNNMYAECIYKYMGYKEYGKGSYANGARVVNDFFRENNLNTAGVNLVDGSGLSRNDRVTADFLCQFLNQVSHMPIYNDFSNSLAIVGQSGTAKNVLPNLPSSVTMKLKTGTMTGVKAYAGYVMTTKGELLSFAVISNGYDCSDAAMKNMLADILYKIAEL